jgi:hypothetical protein
MNAYRHIRIVGLALGISAVSLPPGWAETPEYSGVDLYMANCANCHGTYGEGDGIVTPALALVLKDLRYLSARNDGQFPREYVTEIVDGRAFRAAHGPDGMPVWGATFARGEGFDSAASERVSAKIEALTDFLEAMQIVPSEAESGSSD